MGALDPMYVAHCTLQCRMMLTFFLHPSLFSLGPLLIGTHANVLFYGILVVQAHLYLKWHKECVLITHETQKNANDL